MPQGFVMDYNFHIPPDKKQVLAAQIPGFGVVTGYHFVKTWRTLEKSCRLNTSSSAFRFVQHQKLLGQLLNGVC